ncbi:MAG: hypothetical protein C0592_05445 [Marinilabiliales bacterium]|nr:MAG: hypothetical protein C0592_05445 [Marinilabiliales bacterium]
MESSTIELLPLEGCSLFRFGASEKDVLTVIGEADEVESFEEEGISSAIWYYDEHGLSLFFDKLDAGEMILSGIEMEGTNLTLAGKELFGKGVDAIRKMAAGLSLGEEDSEKEEWGEFRLSYEDKMIDFYFDEDEKLVSISWGME